MNRAAIRDTQFRPARRKRGGNARLSGRTGVLAALAAWLVHPLAILALAVPPVLGASGESANFDPETGFRIKHYRAALPAEVPGGTRVSTEETERIWRDKAAIFVDVMPATGAGFDPRTGAWRLTKSHDHIPGSVWLPDVGRGRISPALERYLEKNLARLSEGRKDRAFLFYCQSDCWMAWNAVQRAAGLGFTKIYWYPEGVDGWSDWDNPMTPAQARPVDVEESGSGSLSGTPLDNR